jgi:Protein of unknown function (DUF3179)
MRALASPIVLLLSLSLASCVSPGAPAAKSSTAPKAEVKTEPLPPLDHAPLLRGKAATYLTADEPVLGIEIGGDARAYPLRVLNRHAVANDTVGRVQVALAWCRPCGSAVLYRTDTPRGTLILAATGRFREGDQLLTDRQTGTLWKQLTGAPAAGPLAGSGVELQLLPVVLTSWGSWLRLHPETRVLSLDTGFKREVPPGGRPEDDLETSSIYGLVAGGASKAYPVDRLAQEGVVNDELAGRPVVLVWEPGADAKHRTIRAYERGNRTFARNERAFLGAIFLTDQDGRPWRLGEEALTTPDGKSLPRLAGRLSYWSGWLSSYPKTLVYGAPSSP